VRAAAGMAAVAVTAILGAAAPTADATLAYVKGAQQGRPVVWVAADDGTGARALARGTSPRVSPDGTQVAYVTGTRRASLKVRPVGGGAARTLARNVWDFDAVRWSADGTALSVVTGPELGPYDLRLVDVATGHARRVARGAFYGVSFAPGGEGLVYARAARETYPVRADLYVAPIAAGTARRITTSRNATNPVWGPSRIAFDRSRRSSRRSDADKLEIYTILPDGTGIHRVTHTRPPFLLSGLAPLAWSADGSRLAAEYEGQDTGEAWRVNPQTGAAADATGAFDGVVGWGLSRDGSLLLASTGAFDAPDGTIIAIAWDGGARTVLARRASQPDWSR